MGLFDLFRRKKQEEKPADTLSLKELELKLQNEKPSLEIQSKEIKEEIVKLLLNLITDLKIKTGIIKGINLDNKKEHEKLKLIVQENLFFYSSCLEKLISGLQKISSNLELEDYASNIAFALSRFEKNSGKSFEKSTILIGKELAEVKKSISDFFQNTRQIIGKNKESLEKLKMVNQILGMIKDVDNSQKITQEIINNIENHENKKKNLHNQKLNQEQKHNETSNGEEYLKFLQERESLNNERNKLDSEIFAFKEKLNLKFLQKYCHSDEKKSLLIKAYQENFISALEADKNAELSKIAKEALSKDLNFEIIRIRQKISERKQEKFSSLAEQELITLEKNIKDLWFEIQEIEKKVEEEKKKIERFKEKAVQLIRDINEISSHVFPGIEITQ